MSFPWPEGQGSPRKPPPAPCPGRPPAVSPGSASRRGHSKGRRDPRMNEAGHLAPAHLSHPPAQVRPRHVLPAPWPRALLHQHRLPGLLLLIGLSVSRSFLDPELGWGSGRALTSAAGPVSRLPGAPSTVDPAAHHQFLGPGGLGDRQRDPCPLRGRSGQWGCVRRTAWWRGAGTQRMWFSGTQGGGDSPWIRVCVCVCVCVCVRERERERQIERDRGRERERERDKKTETERERERDRETPV